MSPIPRRRQVGSSGDVPAKKAPPNPVVVGAIGIVVALLFVYFAFAKHVPFVHGYRVSGVFQNSNQLRKGSPVRMAGVDVGKVVGFEKGPGTTRIVRLELKKVALPIHKDATLRIRPRIFLEGGFYVELQPGSPSAPILDSGGTIPLPQTSIPVQIHQIFDALNRPVRDDLRRMLLQLRTTLTSGGAEALRRLPKPLAPALKDLAIINDAARGTRLHDLSDLISGASRITKGLAARDNELADLVTNFNRTTGALAAESGALRASMRGVDDLLRKAPPALSALDRALPPTTQLVATLRPSLRIAPPVLRQANRVVTQFRGWVRPNELPRLVTNLKPGLLRLPTLNKRLGVLFPLVTPVTDCLYTRVSPVLYSKLQDGKLSTGQPVWQELAHSFVGLSSASQDFDGNGPAVRLQIGGNQGVLLGSDMVGLAPSGPLTGSRPTWLGPGVTPPYRPDQPCRDQKAPDLTARTGGGTPIPTTGAPRTAPRKQLSVRALERELRKLARSGG
jgi:virulence factor Mce-like protein